MKILLFGGGGFIGEYLDRKLKIRSDCEVVVVDRDSSLAEKDPDFDIVVILTQPNGPVKDVLLPAIASAKNIKKIVYCSTLLLYPDSSKRQDENVLPDPKTEYEVAKYQEELLISDFAKQKNVSLCISRLANVYGDVKNRGIINYILLAVLKGSPLTIFGDKDKKVRDYIFIDDIVRFLAFLIFYQQKNTKEIFNICTGRGSSIQNIIDIVESLANKKINFTIGQAILEKQTIIGENKKIVDIAGLAPQHDIAAGLEKTILHYKEFYSG